ncbi:hypothetical protein BDY21DRAFT_416562 [Lineolata rhizophorae]|uniref:Lactonase, 7-bladed beta-propeller-domain-containing protein n=1 Tax=Lineolata rhizophorae TaxID=578093 RepID=A0A6A6NUM8_9PEZI|nr:hypothetical protein BDY21DRAFT_416562 [Lineolata rhizophorae]
MACSRILVCPGVGKAVYFLTNDAENAVVALPIGADGTLSPGTVTSTEGAGSNALFVPDLEPGAPDALLSQSALTIAGNNIFAVNAGSNTVSMMSISPWDPTLLTMVGEPVATPGEFPNTVAASVKNNLVCVATTGAVAGVSCAPFSATGGIGAMDDIRPFDIGQSTPPTGPPNTVSHTFFSSDEAVLFTTVKGDPDVNNTGFLSAFPVEGAGCLSREETRSSPDGTAVLFGSTTIPGDASTLFVTDASFGAAVLSVDPATAEASAVSLQEVDGQMATCWATISSATGSAFVTDTAFNRMVEMKIEDASIISILDLTETGAPGLIDLKAAGEFIYALAPGNGTTEAAITVLDVSGGQGSMMLLQNFGLGVVGAGKSSQGMAALV